VPIERPAANGLHRQRTDRHGIYYSSSIRSGKGIPAALYMAAAITAIDTKVREELEVQVSDFSTMAAIFQRIGFQPLQIYEKYRETFQIQGVEIVLDELPFGNFIELEGEESQIKKLAGELDLEWGNRILNNYLAIMGQVKALYNLPFDDLTFDNFANLDIDLRALTAASHA